MNELADLQTIKESCTCVKVDDFFRDQTGAFTKICSFGTKEDVTKIKVDVQNADDHYKRLWALFGEDNSGQAICLNVGSSNDIKTEIEDIIKMMYTEPEIRTKDSFFHKGMNIYNYITYSDKNCFKYRRMKELFACFTWIEIDVKKYLDENETKGYDPTNYAEVKFASEWKALLWNPAPATNGNQEREISRKINGK